MNGNGEAAGNPTGATPAILAAIEQGTPLPVGGIAPVTAAAASGVKPVQRPADPPLPAVEAGFHRLTVYPAIWAEEPNVPVRGWFLELDELEDPNGNAQPALVFRIEHPCGAWTRNGERIQIGPGGIVRIIATPALKRLRGYGEDPEIVHKMIVWGRPSGKNDYTVDLSQEVYHRTAVDPKRILLEQKKAEAAQRQQQQQQQQPAGGFTAPQPVQR